MKNKIILASLLILSSCAEVVKKVDEATVPEVASGKKVEILFSHNISGETHPCGCRQFPLGGLPQVYGLFTKIKKDAEIIYVDTGDTFFPSSNIPKSMNDSLGFAANNLANGLDKLGLNYYIPGDQDFALGIDFLKNIANTHKFQFLIANLKDESTIKHQRYAIIKKGKATIFLTGLVNPESINTKEAELFGDVNIALKNVISDMQKEGLDFSNSRHRLIVLSHAGIDLDEKLATDFPNIDWIIGSHSQSFLRFSKDVGNVKMVQTLSKNHYIGDITIDLEAKKEVDAYTLHEVRDELEKIATPNPMRDFINAHKEKMSEIQLKEQMAMSKQIEAKPGNQPVKKYQNPVSCLQCHKPQVDFWQGTPHSLAYATLMNVKEQNNLSCVKCHSLGLDDPKGFTSTKNIVGFKDHAIIDYWNDAHAITAKVKSVRNLPTNEIKVLSRKWMDLDKKDNIKHNFANVQCLNCHDKHDEHPFEVELPKSADQKKLAMKNKCLTCHTNDQSPEWYSKNDKGIPTNPNEKVIAEKIKKMSCPAIQ